MTAINITAYTDDASQIDALKAFMKALKIKYDITEGKPYNPEFVSKIKRSRQAYKEGKGTAITVEELSQLWK